MLPKIAFVGTGGTIASIGKDQFDLLDYTATDQRLDSVTLIERTHLQGEIATIVPVNFLQIDSTAITSDDWADLVDLCYELSADPELQGIVIGHGTASLEETAWILSLVLDVRMPVIVTGSMRPLTGISSDSHANLAAAIRVAVARAHEPGVLVVINDEIHAPRAVTKAHTLRLSAFQSPWSGPLGYIDGPRVATIRLADSPCQGNFARELLRHLPRVDIVYSHVGADSLAIRSAVGAGAKGIVSAGFGPGIGTPEETRALGDAISAGLVVVQSTRTGAGRVVDSTHHRSLGIIAGNDLNPQKARILLALCLARGDGPREIERIFQSV
ncbi:asparaginase [Mesorhizobium sp. M0213]|uniref:asparaginase n=1 Tax=Mesorhizobium sp. M0213 TaxID=2956917 RepID=UPI003334CC24